MGDRKRYTSGNNRVVFHRDNQVTRVTSPNDALLTDKSEIRGLGSLETDIQTLVEVRECHCAQLSEASNKDGGSTGIRTVVDLDVARQTTERHQLTSSTRKGFHEVEKRVRDYGVSHNRQSIWRMERVRIGRWISVVGCTESGRR